MDNNLWQLVWKRFNSVNVSTVDTASCSIVKILKAHMKKCLSALCNRILMCRYYTTRMLKGNASQLTQSCAGDICGAVISAGDKFPMEFPGWESG